MIVIIAPPKLFARELAQMTLRAPGAFSLQLSLDAEGASILLFPPTLTQEVMIRGDCGPIQTEIHRNNLVGGFNVFDRNGHHDMQRIASFAVTQICTTGFI